MTQRRFGNSTLAIMIAAAIAISAIVFAVLRISRENGGEDGAAAIRDAVRSRAKQCYVIEGSYPESLDYLTQNYGLAVNTEDYNVIYIAYAENIPPEIKVVPKR